ncbi:MAG: RDD family protein [Micrococcales bacterium]
MTSNNPQAWAGQRLGLPESGKDSLAKMGRRTLALCVDWAAASLISIAFFNNASMATLAVFALEQWLLVGTASASIGHRLLGLRVVSLNGKPLTLWRALIRAGLIVLVVPAAIWDADNRGLHDKAAETALVLR